MLNTKTKLALAAVAALFASQANAALITFTDRAAWEAAVVSFETETFNSITQDTNFGGSSLVFDDLTLDGSAVGGSNVLIDLPAYNSNPGVADIDGSARVNLNGLDGIDFLEVVFDVAVSAFGFDTVNYDVNNDSAGIVVNGIQQGLFPELRDQTGFFGIIDTAGANLDGFSVVNVGTSSVFNAFDNVSYGVAAEVPAPAGLAMFGLGLLGLAATRRKA